MQRFRLPLPLSKRSCRCAVSSTHLATTAQVADGQEGIRCGDGSGVTTNVMVRDVDVGTLILRNRRRLGVVAYGVLFFEWAQLAVVVHHDGAVLVAARRRKDRTHPELVALAGEVGGRWSEETTSFLIQIARPNEPAATSRLGG